MLNKVNFVLIKVVFKQMFNFLNIVVLLVLVDIGCSESE